MKSFHNEDMDFLFQGILTLQTKEACYAFFEDVCTIKEIREKIQDKRNFFQTFVGIFQRKR